VGNKEEVLENVKIDKKAVSSPGYYINAEFDYAAQQPMTNSG